MSGKKITPDNEFWPLDLKKKQPVNFKELQYLWIMKNKIMLPYFHYLTFYGHKN